MKKPKTIPEALMVLWKFAAVVVLGLSVVLISIGLESREGVRSVLPFLLILNLPITLPLGFLYLLRLLWAWLLWNREMKPGELVAGETLEWPARPYFLRAEEREGHISIFGATRSGKSTLAESLARQDILVGNPTIVVDPHAAMAEALTHVSLARGRVPYLLMPAEDHMLTLNLLETGPTYSAFDAARTVAEGLSNVYIPYQEELPVRLRNVLETATYLLARADEDFTILQLPRFILQRPFRDYLAKHVAELSQEDSWLDPEQALTSLAWINNLTRTQLHHHSQSTWTRLVGLLSAPGARRLFGTSRSSFRFEDVHQAIPLFIALEREQLHHAAHLANGMLLNWLTHRLRTRPGAHGGYHEPLYLYLDELGEVSPSIFQSLLLVAGKRSVRLTLLVQAQTMLHPSLRKTLMANLAAMFVLRSVGEGVNELAEEIFVPPTFDGQAFMGDPPMRRSQQLASLAHEIRSLPQHHFLFKSALRPQQPLQGRTVLTDRIPPETGAAAGDYAREQRGRPVKEIDREIREREADLNTRFGPLQEYRDDRILRAMAPW